MKGLPGLAAHEDVASSGDIAEELALLIEDFLFNQAASRVD